MGLVFSFFFNVRPIPPQYQVFINFRGEDIRTGFAWYLFQKLKKEKVNVFIDEKEGRGKKLTNLLTRIKQSRVAVTIFTANYTQSHWCLDELAEIKKGIDEGKIIAIPVFFKISATDVKTLTGNFGEYFKQLKCSSEYKDKTETIEKWEQALHCVSRNFGFCSSRHRFEDNLLKVTVDEVKKALTEISNEEKLIKEENKKPAVIEDGHEIIKKFITYSILFYLLSIFIGPYLLTLAIILTFILDHFKIKEAITSL